MAEDGREYYAQSVEFDPAKASYWVRDHVLSQLKVCHPSQKWNLDRSLYSWQRCEKEDCPWRTREEIRAELLAFCDPLNYGTPELWGTFSAYDHVALAQLFGTMMDLPKGWPMLTYDLVQWAYQLGVPVPEQSSEGEHNALSDARHHQTIYCYLQGFSQGKSFLQSMRIKAGEQANGL